uniref:Uncharacterized protein n=1 Tax=Eptatretus burgeri TaxID=7764 RepID=A0A8C4QTY3_EPTBU
MTTLCANVRSHFGPIPTSIYRALGKTKVPSENPQLPNKNPKDDCLSEWEPIKYLGIPAWIATIVITVLAIILVTVFLFFSFTIDFGGYISSALLGLGGSIAGASTLIMIKYIIVVAYNFILTQKSRIEKEMNNKNFSTQLGFAQQVKEEVKFINNFIRYMEFFEQCKMRLVFKIQDLDRCPQEKITRVLEAKSIILSIKDSRFIYVLAVDPTLIIRSFEYASIKNGYEILNRTVDLPFSIAEMGDNGLKGSFPENEEYLRTENFISEAFNILQNCDKLMFCNLDHRWSTMQRMMITVPLIIRLLFAKHVDPPNSLTPEKIVAWTVLSTQWPCRLSWVLQCEEDIKERMRNKSNDSDGNRFLWDTYTESFEELRVLMNGIDDLFILDGDPNVFEKHLNRDYRFTTSDMEILHPITVNLDRSIQRRMKRLREKHYIRNYHATLSLPVFFLPVLHQLEKILKDNKHLSAYKQCLMDENITGKVLIYSPESEIQKVLNMDFADWALFRAHFLLPKKKTFFSSHYTPLNHVTSCTNSSSSSFCRSTIFYFCRPTFTIHHNFFFNLFFI